jgi:hypothetical protein
MKASKAAVKQAKAVTGLEAKVDLILAHLGIEMPGEGAPQAEVEQLEDRPAAESDGTPELDAEREATEMLMSQEPEGADASQRSQLEENRERIGSRGAAKKTGKHK